MTTLVAAGVAAAGSPADVHKEPAGFIWMPSDDFAAALAKLDDTHNACDERELGYDYWPDGGVRNFWCHAKSVMPWASFVKMAPTIWLRGPHGHWREGKLALHDQHDFGRYNPAFVRWLVDNAVPAATNDALRASTQAVYDKYVRQLARVYFVVHETMEARPAWKKRERVIYLRTMDEKNPDWSSYYEKFSEFLGDGDHAWGGYDPNLQSASVAFWLRRDVDNTGPLFLEGLTKLLRAYDGAWWAQKTAKPHSPAAHATPATPAPAATTTTTATTGESAGQRR